MRILAVRHGEVGMNVRERLSGWIDEELTERGREQAAEVAEKLAVESFETVYASPLKRAAETAGIIAARKPARRVLDARLRERNFGSLCGKNWVEAEAESGLPLRRLDTELMQYDYRPWGGESVDDVLGRVDGFLREMIAAESGAEARGVGASGVGAHDLRAQGERDVVVVSHGGAIKAMYWLLEAEHAKLPISNCSVHVFRPVFKAQMGMGA